jgi:hypothetical protein
MKTKEKRSKVEVPFDPILFAATVPPRKPTPKDRQDCKEDKEDAVEPEEHDSMEEIAKDL